MSIARPMQRDAVLFAPNGQMVKWSSVLHRAEVISCQRAYEAAVNEQTVGPAAYRDVQGSWERGLAVEEWRILQASAALDSCKGHLVDLAVVAGDGDIALSLAEDARDAVNPHP